MSKEVIFIGTVQSLGVPAPKLEYPFAKELGRRFRFDYCWPEKKLALEVEGGVWTGGGHSRPSMFVKDVEKYNLATLLGWRVLRCYPTTLMKLETVEMVKKAYFQDPWQREGV